MKPIYLLFLALAFGACRHDAIVDVPTPAPVDSPVTGTPIQRYPKVDSFDGIYMMSEAGYMGTGGELRLDTSIRTTAVFTRNSDTDAFLQMRIYTAFPERNSIATAYPTMTAPRYLELAQKARLDRKSGNYRLLSGSYYNSTITIRQAGDSLIFEDWLAHFEAFLISDRFYGKHR